MIKWIISKIHKHSPVCMCGYKMKPTQKRLDEYSWKCIWKKCGWESYQSSNGKLHWFRSK